MKKVAILMGSDSDFDKVAPAFSFLKAMGVPFEARVCSAHRTPDLAAEFAQGAAASGFGAIIAAAGKSAHLAGALAANTLLPVIGVPISAAQLDGLDALLSTAQMPPGIPVATVAIDGGLNAAILACQMLALSDSALMVRLAEYREKMRGAVLERDALLRERIDKI